MFLIVHFGDNDFGQPVICALRRIWHDVAKNNWMITNDRIRETESRINKSYVDIFNSLHSAGILQPMIELAIDCEFLYGRVEFATRGHYSPRKFKQGYEPIERELISITHVYLNVHLSFVKKRPTRWANGEKVWLNLITGDVKLY